MREKLKTAFSVNGLFWSYSFVFLMILYGVFEVCQSTYMGNLALYFAVFTSAYWALFFLVKKLDLKRSVFEFPPAWLKVVNPLSLISISILFIIVHFIYINGFPSNQEKYS